MKQSGNAHLTKFLSRLKLQNKISKKNYAFKYFQESPHEEKILPTVDPYSFSWSNDILKLDDPKNKIDVYTSNVPENNLLEIEKKPRYNEFGIQMISEQLFTQLFSTDTPKKDKTIINQCLQELQAYNFDKIQTPSPDVNLNLPHLEGSSVEEHFYKIGEEQSKPYRDLIFSLFTNCPVKPTFWLMKPGWVRYGKDGVTAVDFPLEDAVVFDVEVCCSAGPLPTLATAVTKDAWYGWVSDDLVFSPNKTVKHIFTPDHLIPLESKSGDSASDISDSLIRPRIAVGHNVSFDRAKVKEQYWLKRTGMRFLDTMSLHICISGVTSYQKALLKAGVGNEEWSKLSSLNGLGKVYELYCGKKLSKSDQQIFLTGTLSDVRDNFQKLMNYCANDVSATFSILEKMFPLFLKRFPHPVTLAGMLELQSTYIPINENWKKYLVDSQQSFEDLNLEAKNVLACSANEACRLLHNDKYKQDLWLWDQDWSVKHLNLKKFKKNKSQHNFDDKKGNTKSSTTNTDSDIVENRMNVLKHKFKDQRDLYQHMPLRNPHLPGYPKWFTKMCNKPNDPSWIPEPELISTGMKIVPKLLRLTWKLMPLHCEKRFGWGYLIPYKTDIVIEHVEKLPKEVLINYFMKECKTSLCLCENEKTNENANTYICSKKTKTKQNGFNFCRAEIYGGCGMIKLPHKDGNELNVGNPLSHDFINKFSDSELSGASIHSKKVIEISRMMSYWRNNRERIENQFVCWLSKHDLPTNHPSDYEMGVILPQVVVCGTLTRRAVEPTWMTVSNAVVERIGSELRGIVQAPPGYSLVGADVDSQELWIASLLGDAYYSGMHGSTPFSWMTLNGQKSDGTDMHSITAKTVGISRNHAKILNYARIYGAGQKFAERLLKQFNPDMTVSEAATKARKMMSLTKGKRMYKLKQDFLTNVSERVYTKEDAREICLIHQKDFNELFSSAEWHGGSESSMFNCLEEIANKVNPRTPFLHSQLSRALEPNLDEKDKFGTTRINWVVQSGAVDFLHLMLVSMRWFLGFEARFCLSFHDEVRYLVPENKKYETALAVHITNLLTRAFCVKKLGMSDLPHSVAFFSSVDVDVVLRKESNDDNRTPSNPFGLTKGYGVPIGESLDIYQSIKMAKGIVGTRSC